jgi:hypothetical protein
MAKQKTRDFRVGKIEIIKAVARRPKGLYRPDLIHKDAKKYDRKRAKAETKRVSDE